MQNLDPYDELEVSTKASSEVIDAAYRRLAKKYHPDSGDTPDSSRMIRINQAYETLSSPRSRSQYDARTSGRSGDTVRLDLKSLLQRAAAAAEAGRWQEVRRLTDQILQVSPNSIEAFLYRAEVAVASEDWTELEAASRAVLGLAPSNKDGLLYAAYAAVQRRDWFSVRSLAAVVLVSNPADREARDLWDEAEVELISALG